MRKSMLSSLLFVALLSVGMLLSSIPAEAQVVAYVTNFGVGGGDPGGVSVINTGTNTVVASFRVGRHPIGVAITPDGTRAYVTRGTISSGFVSVIDTETNTVVATVPVPRLPQGVAITPDGTRVYVVNQRSRGAVAVINTGTNTVVATVRVGRSPIAVAITPDGTLAYVTEFSFNNVSVIDTGTNTIVARVRVGFAPRGLAFTPDGNLAYVTNSGSGTVSVIDTGTKTVVATVRVGRQPHRVAIASLTFNSPPIVRCKDIDLDLDASGQATLAPAQVDDGSSDPDGDPITLSLDRTTFDCDDLGPQTVTLTVTDDNGASASCPATVTVKDVTPPTLSVSASPSSLWPPNHKYHTITLTITANDACDLSPAISAVVVSSEPDEAKGNGDGNTTGDIKVMTTGGGILLSSNDVPEVPWKPGEQLELRAERDGKGDGRVYSITVTAKDASGNKTTANEEIAVTHDKGKAPKPVAGVGVGSENLILGDDRDAFDGPLGVRFGLAPENLSFRLFQNSPNPFNPSTTIRYTLDHSSEVRLKIHNTLGQAVRVLVSANQSAGRYNVNWDGRDASGKLVASGLYIYRLEAGAKVALRKMIFAK